MENKYLTVNDIYNFLKGKGFNLSRNAIYYWINNGYIPAFQFTRKGRVYVKVADVLKFLREVEY